MDFLGRYSNLADQDLRLKELATRSVQGTPPIRTRTNHQAQTRLREDQALALIADYQEGATVSELADRYDVDRVTASRILHRHSVTMRFRSPSPAEVDEAVRLYRSGLSLVGVGERLGFSNTTVWSALRAAGVEMRPRRGGPKPSSM